MDRDEWFHHSRTLLIAIEPLVLPFDTRVGPRSPLPVERQWRQATWRARPLCCPIAGKSRPRASQCESLLLVSWIGHCVRRSLPITWSAFCIRFYITLLPWKWVSEVICILAGHNKRIDGPSELSARDWNLIWIREWPLLLMALIINGRMLLKKECEWLLRARRWWIEREGGRERSSWAIRCQKGDW